MKVLRGELRGQDVAVDQYCGDWISATTREGRPLILNPTSVEITTEEVVWFHAHADQAGRFWDWYRLSQKRFQRLRPVRHRGRLVRPEDEMGTERVGGSARELTPAELAEGERVRPDTAEADMLRAVASGSVIYSARKHRSGWVSMMDSGGFTHIGQSGSGVWGAAEQEALDTLAQWGMVMLRQQMHWVPTPVGRVRFVALSRSA